jgi:hypothetical protein
MKGTIIAALFFCISGFAQTFSPVQPVDFSNTTTKPMQTGILSSRPTTCSVGQQYFATDAAAGQNVSLCVASNVWVASSNGIMSDITAGANSLASMCSQANALGEILTIQLAWTSQPTETLNCTLWFIGGSIQPTSGAEVTFTVANAPTYSICDVSHSGTCHISTPSGIYLPQWQNTPLPANPEGNSFGQPYPGPLAGASGFTISNDSGPSTAGFASLDSQTLYTPTSPSTANIGAMIANSYWTGTIASPSGVLYGAENQATANFQTGGSLGYVIGTNSIAGLVSSSSGVNGSAGTVTAVAGLVEDEAGTIAVADVFGASAVAVNRTSAIITTEYNFHGYGCGTNSGATIGTCYGFYQQAGAGTVNIAIKTEPGAGPEQFGGEIQATEGSLSALAYSFQNKLNCGMDYLSSALTLACGGIAGLTINSSGRVVVPVSLSIGAAAVSGGLNLGSGNLLVDGTVGEVIVTRLTGNAFTGAALSSDAIGTVEAQPFYINYANSPVLTIGSNTIAYAPTGWTTVGDVPCFKTGGVIGYAHVTAGAVGICN